MDGGDCEGLSEGREGFGRGPPVGREGSASWRFFVFRRERREGLGGGRAGEGERVESVSGVEDEDGTRSGTVGRGAGAGGCT